MPPTEQQQQPQPQSPKPDKDPTQETMLRASVTQWVSRIKHARNVKFKEDFKRMRENMKFDAGLQWPGQKKMTDARYTANWVNHNVNEKVAQLYARNPTVEYQRRKRLDFALYNGRLETLVPIVQQAMGNPMGLMGLAPQQLAIIADFMHGMQQRDLVDRIGKTLETLFQYQLDEQVEEDGEFKLQMKSCTRRTVVCGVGYCRVSFARDINASVTSSGLGATMVNRAKLATALLEKVSEGKLEDTSPHIQTLQSLLTSLQVSLVEKMRDPEVKERLVFDFIPSSKIIVDPLCRNLKGFIGARWVAQEYILPVTDVAALFEKPDLTIASGVKQYNPQGIEQPEPTSTQQTQEKEPLCCMWELLDKRAKNHFFVVDGYKDYLLVPEPLEPSVRGFWPIVALTFNDVEVEEDLPATIYPPSDVDLLRHPQKEWNRSRNELKKHRKGSGPGYLVSAGMLTDEDKDNLENQENSSVVEIQGCPVGTDLGKVIIPRPTVAIQPPVYDSGTMREDIAMLSGQQPAPQIPQKRGTATGETLAEQRNMTVTGSNVDDQDDFLCRLVEIGGELLLKEMSKETVMRICGPGAVWPQAEASRSEYLNQIYLVSKAASSGRPNKQLELNNWKIVGPMLMQMGANPMFLVRETLRRLDDQIDPEQAFPLVPPQPAANNMPQDGQHQPGEQEQHQPGQNVPPKQDRPGPSKVGPAPKQLKA